MSIPAGWRVVVQAGSQGVVLAAENTFGEVVCPLLKITHEQAGQLSAALLSMRRTQREALPAPMLPAPMLPAPMLPAPMLPAPMLPAPMLPAPMLPAPLLPVPA